MTAPVHWLLLRGLVRERRHWGEFPTQLAARTGGSVLSLDLPGVGTERHRPAPTTITGMVTDLRERFQAQRDGGRWRIFAPSLGGMVAMTWAEQHPGDFEEVAICNSSAHGLARPLERLSPEAIRTIFLGLFSTDPQVRERRVLDLISNTDGGRAQLDRFVAISREAPVPPAVLFRQLLAASGAKAPSSLPVPVLVLCSNGDRLCSPTLSRRLAERLGGRLAIHPHGGHDLPLDDPGWVLDRLVEGATHTNEDPGSEEPGS
jgi:pimeloyl-ACP methyl ester carboxylesterase